MPAPFHLPTPAGATGGLFFPAFKKGVIDRYTRHGAIPIGFGQPKPFILAYIIMNDFAFGADTRNTLP